MKMSVEVLKAFGSPNNAHFLSEESLKYLIKQCDLENVDLAEEKQKIESKSSDLSRAKRDYVVELYHLKTLVDEKKQNEELAMNMDMTNQSSQNLTFN